jgi:hypothetical protein
MLLIFIYGINIFAEYKEGIDTTYSNGNSIDGTFRVGPKSIYAENKLIVFHFDSVDIGEWYFYNYSFDEIKKAPALLPVDKWIQEYNCETPFHKPFVVNRGDNTYSKIEIINQLPSGEYIFNYGINDEPSNTLLAPSDYSRDSLYKPNNVIFCISDPTKEIPHVVLDIQWNPPLENNYELIGYEVYKVEKSMVDTSQEIDLSKWKLVEFTSTTQAHNYSEYLGFDVYWNVIAVYINNNDTVSSKPLEGWTLLPDRPCVIYDKSSNRNNKDIVITIENYCIHINDLSGNSYHLLDFYDLLGRKILSINNINRNGFIKLNQNLSAGVYVVKTKNKTKAFQLK